MNTESSPKPRVPLAASVANRDGSTFVDARLINGYLEKGEDKIVHAYRRPGVTLYQQLPPGPGRGIFNWHGDIYAVVGTKLYKNGVDTKVVLYDNGKKYEWTPILSLPRKLFFHNALFAYIWDGFTLTPLVSGIVKSLTGDTTAGSPTILNISSTTGLLVNSGVTSSVGILPGSYITSVDSATQVTLNAPAQNTFAALRLTFSTPGYPAEALVPGLAYLDATTYVMAKSARIFGSSINDVSSVAWQSSNYLTAQIEPDDGVYLTKQLVYVVAFCEWSTEFFYDAGNAVGSPLAPVQGNKISQGCRDAGTVTTLEGEIFWVSTTREGNVNVFHMAAARGVPIATPSVEKLLQNANFAGCYSFGFHISGHKYYVLTIPLSNLTLVYDLVSQEWYRWTDTNENYWPYVDSTIGLNQQVILQHETDGGLYQISSSVHTDNGLVIPWDLYTGNWDGGARTTKILTRLDFIGDQIPGTIIKTRVSDDDYKSWSQFRTVDMGKKRPNLRDCGSFRRRAWHFSNRTDTFLRIQAVELHVTPGTD